MESLLTSDEIELFCSGYNNLPRGGWMNEKWLTNGRMGENKCRAHTVLKHKAINSKEWKDVWYHQSCSTSTYFLSPPLPRLPPLHHSAARLPDCYPLWALTTVNRRDELASVHRQISFVASSLRASINYLRSNSLKVVGIGFHLYQWLSVVLMIWR